MNIAEERCSRGDGRSLSFRVLGDGPTLICYPNPYMNSRLYFGDLAEFASIGRLILVDPRGTGESDPAESFAMADHVADLECVRDALGLEQTSVLGHSSGALVALGWAVEHPERVGRVFMLNGALRAMTDAVALPAAIEMIQGRHGSAPYFQEGFEALLRLGDVDSLDPVEATAIRYAAFQLFIENREDSSLSALKRLCSCLPHPASQRQFDSERAAGFDFKGRLGETIRPVTVITGEYDPTTVGAVYAGETADEIPGAELVVVPGAGHGLWFEAPDALRAELATRIR